MQNNPLTQYYRQPKIFLSLPSRGRFYPENSLRGDPLGLPVYGMTAMDEILFKTPDALFTGEAVVQVIKSCIPGIVDPWNIPQLDIDSVLISIRIATYGEKMPLQFSCTSCKEKNDVEIDLPSTLDYFSSLEYHSEIKHKNLIINVKPITYKQQTEISLQTYQLQKKLYMVQDIKDEEERNRILNESSKELNTIQINSFKDCIDSIITEDGEVVKDKSFIHDWLDNADREYYNKIKNHLLDIRKTWILQPQKIECSECGHLNEVEVGFDNSNFFGNP
ncbi:MAG: hypothetical protein ACOCQD_02220 [archaeon]